jgi:hypothetical protein
MTGKGGRRTSASERGGQFGAPLGRRHDAGASAGPQARERPPAMLGATDPENAVCGEPFILSGQGGTGRRSGERRSTGCVGSRNRSV